MTQGRMVAAGVLGLALLMTPTALVAGWVHAAKGRLAAAEREAASDAANGEGEVAIAAAADVGYCNGDLKRVLRRVLQSCGLLGEGGGVRGCQPVQARSVATMSGEDFNALFTPLAGRAGIIEFDFDRAELDAGDTALVNRLFADQRGASYFFVVARASPEGNDAHNRDLSKERAEAVMSYLRTTFQDPDLDKEVGLLWLGEEYAQLDAQFCTWQRSGGAGECDTRTLNRSAFIAWIDCRL
jgi:outer membrane protein OmpA-like peptidoglycan-associated protein